MAPIVCCEGPKFITTALLHFSSGEISQGGNDFHLRRDHVINFLPLKWHLALSRRYLLTCSASLKSFKTSLLSRKTQGRRSAAATAMFVYCCERVSGLALSPYSTSHPAVTLARVSGADCSTYRVFTGFRTRTRHFNSWRWTADRLRRNNFFISMDPEYHHNRISKYKCTLPGVRYMSQDLDRIIRSIFMSLFVYIFVLFWWRVPSPLFSPLIFVFFNDLCLSRHTVPSRIGCNKLATVTALPLTVLHMLQPVNIYTFFFSFSVR